MLSFSFWLHERSYFWNSIWHTMISESCLGEGVIYYAYLYIIIVFKPISSIYLLCKCSSLYWWHMIETVYCILKLQRRSLHWIEHSSWTNDLCWSESLRFGCSEHIQTPHESCQLMTKMKMRKNLCFWMWNTSL